MQDRASSTTTIKDFKKMLLRQLNKIEYLNVDLIPGYEATEIEYRQLSTVTREQCNVSASEGAS